MKTLFLPGPVQDRNRAIEILAELEEQTQQDPELMKFRAVHMLEQSTPESIKIARENLENAINSAKILSENSLNEIDKIL